MGRICILDIDVQGVRSVKKASFPATPRYVFIMPPARPTHLKVLEDRIRRRGGGETEEKIQLRLQNARVEIEYAEEKSGANFDVVIENDVLDTAVQELVDKIKGW